MHEELEGAQRRLPGQPGCRRAGGCQEPLRRGGMLQHTHSTHPSLHRSIVPSFHLAFIDLNNISTKFTTQLWGGPSQSLAQLLAETCSMCRPIRPLLAALTSAPKRADLPLRTPPPPLPSKLWCENAEGGHARRHRSRGHLCDDEALRRRRARRRDPVPVGEELTPAGWACRRVEDLSARQFWFGGLLLSL